MVNKTLIIEVNNGQNCEFEISKKKLILIPQRFVLFA